MRHILKRSFNLSAPCNTSFKKFEGLRIIMQRLISVLVISGVNSQGPINTVGLVGIFLLVVICGWMRTLRAAKANADSSKDMIQSCNTMYLLRGNKDSAYAYVAQTSAIDLVLKTMHISQKLCKSLCNESNECVEEDLVPCDISWEVLHPNPDTVATVYANYNNPDPPRGVTKTCLDVYKRQTTDQQDEEPVGKDRAAPAEVLMVSTGSEENGEFEFSCGDEYLLTTQEMEFPVYAVVVGGVDEIPGSQKYFLTIPYGVCNSLCTGCKSGAPNQMCDIKVEKLNPPLPTGSPTSDNTGDTATDVTFTTVSGSQASIWTICGILLSLIFSGP
eukprot:GHVP01025135.1.p1 GENE.GHVP01025135.1~~GHVP01025135.1.p1  ORF type:complete len:331 (-),score=40.12 GHVP01025135.1:47-1039(-)